MRMDRYEEDEVKERQTRTTKNQELYTDVYLNNAYVDISDLKEVMEDTSTEREEQKVSKNEVTSYSYEDKNYDIVSIIDEAIKKKGNDKIKRSLENDEDVENIIESINEIQREKNMDDTLLSDLMPDRDTEVIPPLEKPILDTSILDTSIIHQDEMSMDMLEEVELQKKEEVESKEKIELDEPEKTDDEMDNSFKEETNSKKKILFIILGIILVIGIVVGILIWKKIIKF